MPAKKLFHQIFFENLSLLPYLSWSNCLTFNAVLKYSIGVSDISHWTNHGIQFDNAAGSFLGISIWNECFKKRETLCRQEKGMNWILITILRFWTSSFKTRRDRFFSLRESFRLNKAIIFKISGLGIAQPLGYPDSADLQRCNWTYLVASSWKVCFRSNFLMYKKCFISCCWSQTPFIWSFRGFTALRT